MDPLMEEPDDGFLTSEEMLAAEVDIAKGLSGMNDRAGALLKSPIHLRQHDKTELWLRNPAPWAPLLAEVQFPRFVNNSEYTQIKQPFSLLDKHLPDGYEFSLINILSPGEAYLYTRSGSHPRSGSGDILPVGKVPCWKWGDNPEDLIRMCRAYERRGWDRIIVGWLPTKTTKKMPEGIAALRARIFSWLHRVGLAFPHVNLHLFGGKSYRHCFGLNFASADYDPTAGIGKVTLPNGKVMHETKGAYNLKWLHVLGYGEYDLQTVRDRTLFGMHSAMWASENYCSETALRHTVNGRRADPYGLAPERKGRVSMPRSYEISEHRRKHVRGQVINEVKGDPRMFEPEITPDFFPMYSSDAKEPYAYAEPIQNLPLVPIRSRFPQTMDRVLCDSCSLAPSCNYVRDSGVCIVPSSETKALARMFGTRDVDTLKDALQGVLAMQATRHTTLAESWDKDFEDPEQGHKSKIDKSKHLMELENSLTRGVEALIKIMDPTQRVGTVPATSGPTINVYNPATLVADVVKRLEAAGIERSAISPAMVIEAARDQGIDIESKES